MADRSGVVRSRLRSFSRIRWYFVLAAAIYFGAAAVGVTLVGTPRPGVDGASTATPPGFVTIVVSNLQVLVTLSFGGVLLAIPTLMNLLLNGVAFGMVVTSAAHNAGPLVVASLFVPHGIFEIPALLLSGAAGLLIPGRFVAYLRGLEPRPFDTRDVGDFLTVLIVAVALLVVGALVEATVTPWAYAAVS